MTGRLRLWVRGQPVVAFYFLAFAITWLGWIPHALHSRNLCPFDSLLFYVLGGVGPMRSRGQLDEELGKFSWLTPVAVEMFGEKYDPSELGFSHRLLTTLPASLLHGLPASDVRDWAEIRAWGNDLAQKLGTASPK